MRYIESVNTLYLAKILNYIVYEEIAIYINYILHDVCFPKNMGVMPRATLVWVDEPHGSIFSPICYEYNRTASLPSTYVVITLYWNGQLVWTPAVGHYLCVGASGTGDCVQRDLSPTFLRRRHQRQTLAFL